MIIGNPFGVSRLHLDRVHDHFPSFVSDGLASITPLPLDSPPSKRSQNSSDPLIQSARRPRRSDFIW